MFLGNLLGWTSAFLLFLLILLYLVRRFCKFFKLFQHDSCKKSSIILSKIHPYIGGLIIITGITHGYIVMSGHLRLHTGTILWALILVAGLFFVLGNRFKFKLWLKYHRWVALAVFIAFITHYFFRDLI